MTDKQAVFDALNRLPEAALLEESTEELRIMSGWLGAVNYGVIVSNDVDSLLLKTRSAAKTAT